MSIYPQVIVRQEPANAYCVKNPAKDSFVMVKPAHPRIMSKHLIIEVSRDYKQLRKEERDYPDQALYLAIRWMMED